LFVIRAIIGYIPKKIFSQHSFTIRIHTKVGYTYGLSDTQRYKTLGNAVTVKVVEEIAKTIKKIL
jgi:site-specific DNA-cytosine methylase